MFFRMAALGGVMALMAPAVLSASDPLDGTWDLDVAASRFDPGPRRTSDTRTYEVDGDSIRLTGSVVYVDGRSERIHFDAAFDGKDYPAAGNPRVGTIAQVRVDAYTSKTTTRRDGKVMATSTRQVSPDGGTLTITTTGTDEKGAAFNNTLVFRKRSMALTLAAWATAADTAPQAKKAESVVGWVSDGHCGAEHMKTGGAGCVRKCIAGAEHVNPQWKPGGMVFVTEDKQLWKVDNPDALWGHESEQLEVLGTRNAEKKSIKVEKIVEVRQK